MHNLLDPATLFSSSAYWPARSSPTCGQCGACGHADRRSGAEGQVADPARCDYCNP